MFALMLQAAKPAASWGLEKVPIVGSYLEKLAHLLAPDMKLWWLFAITFPLTLIWMIWGSAELKKFFNNVGGTVACGLPALALLLGFWGAFLGVALTIFGKVTGILALAMNPSLRGTWDMALAIIKMIPLFIAIWLLKKIPGLEGLVREILGKVSELSRKIWGYRANINQNPHWFWQVLGGLLLALLINSSLVTRLSERVLPDVPGVIPGISGAVGVFFFFYRTVFGQKLREKVSPTNKPLPDGKWHCQKCKHLNLSASKACEKCGVKSPFLPWDCSKGDKKGISWDVKRCPECGEKKVEVAKSAAKTTTTPKAATVPQGAAAVSATPKLVPCPHCHKGIDMADKPVHCPECGKNLGEKPWKKRALTEL